MKIVVVDIDGTVSILGDRLKYLKKPQDWDAFYNACLEDEPNEPVVEMIKFLSSHYLIIFCTGRVEGVRKKTEVWLEKHGLSGPILMRPDGDFRHDRDVKPEQLSKAGYALSSIAFVLEDRSSMVEKWRSLGLTCLQVAKGNF